MVVGVQRSSVVVVVVVALALAACSSDGSEPSATSGAPAADITTAATIVPNTSGDDADAAPAATAPAAPASTAVPTSEPAADSTVVSSVPTSTVAPTPVTEPAPPPSDPSVDPAFDLSAVDPIVQAFVDQRGLNGAGLVVVQREAGIVHEGYWGEFDRDRRSFVASSSKMITAGVLGRLADDGLLDLDAPVADQVGWQGNPTITPAQLVSNSSGLVGLFPDLGYRPYRCQFDPGGTLSACGASIFETPDDDADVIPPDSDFRYGGGQWQVAGAVAEAVSGRTWAELIDEVYVEPCGVDTLGFNNHFARAAGLRYPEGLDPAALEPSDNPNMEGGAFVAPPDYGELLLMHLRGGMCEGGQVLSPAMVDRLHTDRTLATYPNGAAVPGYGMGWWVDRSSGRLQDGGAYGSLPWLDLEAGWGAFLVIEADSATGFELWQEIEPTITAVMAP